MPAWPGGVPCQPMQGTFARIPTANVVASENDVGPPIMRRRFTGMTIMETGTLVLTKDEADILFNFWADTLAQGSLEFVKPTWYDGALKDHYFPPDTPPTFTRQGGSYFCAMTLCHTITT